MEGGYNCLKYWLRILWMAPNDVIVDALALSQSWHHRDCENNAYCHYKYDASKNEATPFIDLPPLRLVLQLAPPGDDARQFGLVRP